ncbi:MAG: SpoIID/LytB domain-containing protein, partial [Candidatus Edwardsbacteria bacterium]|nr:SpoIID/LytB domain-containing protein [Candidatus Edwardsbacteria bacterium]
MVGAELGMAKPEELEAAKAQAVASRSYAHCKIGSKPGAGYDIEASVSEQAFDPAKASPTVLKAVRQTEGMVLTCGGRVVAANYHSTCGGRTALASEAWTADDRSFPFIKSVKDGYCDISPRFSWRDSFPSTDIALRLLDTGLAVDDVAVTARGPSGRAVALRVSAQTCDTTLYRDRIR